MGWPLPPAAAAVSITALTTAVLSRARFIYPERASTHLLVIQGLNRRVSRVILHLYETKSTKSTGLPIRDHRHADDLAVLGKQIPDLLLSRRVGQVAYINTLGHLNGSPTRAPLECVPRNRPGLL